MSRASDNVIMAPTTEVAADSKFAVIIDDDAKVRQLITTTLTQLNFRVESFEAAKEAILAIEICHPALIFLDIALLRSDAIDVLHGLRERRYQGAVQLITGLRQSLLEAVERIGVRNGIRLLEPVRKPLSHEVIVQIAQKFAAHDHSAINCGTQT
jgi:DNA-binding NtrC family response regulator